MKRVGALILTYFVPFLLLGSILILCSGTEAPERRLRVLRRHSAPNGAGILSPIASETGRSLSGGSGWRVSFNNLGNRWKSSSADNSTDEWIALLKATAVSATVPPVAATFLVNETGHEIQPRLQKYPKKTMISKPIVGNIKRQGNEISATIVTATPFTTTAAATTVTVTSTELPRAPLLKNYVEIERKVEVKNLSKPVSTKKEQKHGEYRAAPDAGIADAGRGFMRRNGEAQQFPHNQHQFQGHAQQPYLPHPQQHDGYIDPYHPVVQNSLNQPPHNPLQHQQQDFHRHPVSKHDHHNSLMPMDKTLVYVAMIVTWIFWIVAFTTYYNLWGPHGKIHRYGGPVPPTLNIDDVHGKQDSSDGGSGIQPHVIHARSLDTSAPSGWNVNWNQVLYMISLAQEAYEKFDFRSMDCQKKALCELAQKDSTEFGETGRKISNSFSFMEVVEGLPMPTIIQNYLKEYRGAITDGKNNFKPCSEIYATCGFSLKEMVGKYKKKAESGKF